MSFAPVAPFAFSTFIGVGFGLPVPGSTPIDADPKGEYVAGGYVFAPRNIPQVLPWMVDDLTRDFGPQVYDAMTTDPVVAGTFRLLKMQVLAGKFEIMPALQPAANLRHEKYRAKWSPDEQLARDIADFHERGSLGCETPVATVFSEMLDSMKYGNKLAEVVLKDGVGPDAGKLTLGDVKVKPYWAWMFVVDVFLNVLGYLAFDPELGGFVVVPKEKFWRMSWQVRDNDPRGTALFRGPYRGWNLKNQLYPEYWKYLTQFAGPSIFGFTAEGEDTTNRGGVGPDGKPLKPGQTLTAQQYMAKALELCRNGSVGSFPSGAKVQVEHPRTAGEAFLKAFDFLDRQIVHGILGSTRDSMEAEHGSKADSGTAQDKVGNLIRTAREDLARGWRGVLKRITALNWGEEIAERFTPEVIPPATEHHDAVAMMDGIANLAKSGVISRSQLPEIYAMLGLPQADPDADLEDEVIGRKPEEPDDDTETEPEKKEDP